MTIEQKGKIIIDPRYIVPTGGVLGMLFRRSDVVTGISLVPDKNNSAYDSVIIETSSERAKLLVGSEINLNPVCRQHKITWQP